MPISNGSIPGFFDFQDHPFLGLGAGPFQVCCIQRLAHLPCFLFALFAFPQRGRCAIYEAVAPLNATATPRVSLTSRWAPAIYRLTLKRGNGQTAVILGIYEIERAQSKGAESGQAFSLPMAYKRTPKGWLLNQEI
eukprot:s1452_g9.t1